MNERIERDEGSSQQMVGIDTAWLRARLRAVDKEMQDLAKHLGVTPGAVTLLFQGKRRWDLNVTAAVAEFVNVDILEIAEHVGVKLSRKPLLATLVVDVNGDARPTFSSQQPIAHAPGEINANLCATIDSPGPLLGAAVYFGLPAAADRAVGRVVLVQNGGRARVRTLARNADDAARYDLLPALGCDSEPETGLSAGAMGELAPLVWIRMKPLI